MQGRQAVSKNDVFMAILALCLFICFLLDDGV